MNITVARLSGTILQRHFAVTIVTIKRHNVRLESAEAPALQKTLAMVVFLFLSWSFSVKANQNGEGALLILKSPRPKVK